MQVSKASEEDEASFSLEVRFNEEENRTYIQLAMPCKSDKGASALLLLGYSYLEDDDRESYVIGAVIDQKAWAFFDRVTDPKGRLLEKISIELDYVEGRVQETIITSISREELSYFTETESTLAFTGRGVREKLLYPSKVVREFLRRVDEWREGKGIIDQRRSSNGQRR